MIFEDYVILLDSSIIDEQRQLILENAKKDKDLNVQALYLIKDKVNQLNSNELLYHHHIERKI